MKTGMVPDLALRQLHMLITKELLTLYELSWRQIQRARAASESRDRRE